MRRRTFLALLYLSLLNLVVPGICYPQDKDEEASNEGKKLIFWLDSQAGAAYENGNLVRSFRIISGLDGWVQTPDGQWVVKRTPKGKLRVLWKSAGYVNSKGIPMPYSLFFTKGRHAIHAWSLDEPLPPVPLPWEDRYTSSGCISVDRKVAPWLFDWADEETPIYIKNERTQ